MIDDDYDDDCAAAEAYDEEVSEAAEMSAADCRELLALHTLARHGLPEDVADRICEALAEEMWDYITGTDSHDMSMAVRDEMLKTHAPTVAEAAALLAKGDA
jgi:hypothetical protein